MRGEGGCVDDRTVPEVIEGLRALLRAIERGGHRDQERQIRALHEAGEPVPALVTTFGVSRATVYRLLAEVEVPA